MPLTYIRGRSGSGKTRLMLDKIKALLNKNPLETVYVLVPEQATFRMERELIEALGTGGLWGVSVLSFDRLVQVLLSQYGGASDAPLDFIGKTMIVRTILDQHRDELTVFRKSAAQPGFEIKITEQLSELKRQDVSLEALNEVRSAGIDPSIREKLDDICLLYSAYQSRLASVYLDDADLVALAIRAAEQHGFFKGAHVFADGFDLLTNQLLRLLVTAVKQAGSAVITFRMPNTADTDKRVFDPETKRFALIDAAVRADGISTDIIDLSPVQIGDTRFRSADIRHLEQNLFAYPFRSFDTIPENIVLSSLDSRQQEVKDVCAKIIALLKDGYRFRDIALCVSDLRQYRSALASAFKENEIPYFMDAKTKLLDTAIAEFLAALLDFIIYKSTEDFIVYAKSGFLDIDDALLYAFENHIARFGIKGYQLNYPFKHAGDGAEEARTQLCPPVFALIDQIKSTDTAETFGTLILDFLKQIGVDQHIEAFATTLEAGGDLDNALVFSQVFEKIIGIIEQSCVTFQNSRIPFESFVSAVKAGLEAAEIAVIPPSVDDVLIGDFKRTVFPETKVLFVLGLNDGKIPSAPDTASILTDHEKIALEKQGIRAGYRDRFFEERLKIYAVFSKPSEKLYLSYANRGEKDEAKPSVLVGRLCRIFPMLSVETHDPKTTVYAELSKAQVFRDLSFALAQKLDGLNIADEWRGVYSYFSKDSAYSPQLNILENRLLSPDKTESIKKETAGALYHPISASISRAERYHTCPFLYFMDYGIMPQKREPFETTPLDIGTFLHDCLNAFVLRLKDAGLKWGDASDIFIEQETSAIAQGLKNRFKNGIFSSDNRYLFVFERLALEFTSAVKIIRDQFSGTEADVFASELLLKDADYLTFTLSDGTPVSLTCKIDRVDSVENEDIRIIRIIDYKSSSKLPSLKELYYGLSIQLMIYLKFVVEYFKSKGETVKIGGALYMDLSLPQTEDTSPENLLKLKTMRGFITDDTYANTLLSAMDGNRFVAMAGSVNKDGSMRKSDTVLSGQAFDALFNHGMNQLIGAMDGVLSGNITPLPVIDRQDTPCTYCDYNSVCGFDGDADAYRVISDISRQDFGIEG